VSTESCNGFEQSLSRKVRIGQNFHLSHSFYICYIFDELVEAATSGTKQEMAAGQLKITFFQVYQRNVNCPHFKCKFLASGFFENFGYSLLLDFAHLTREGSEALG